MFLFNLGALCLQPSPHTSKSACRSSSKPKSSKKPASSLQKQYLLKEYAEQTLGSGNLRLAVHLPEGEDLNEWLAVNSKLLFMCPCCLFFIVNIIFFFFAVHSKTSLCLCLLLFACPFYCLPYTSCDSRTQNDASADTLLFILSVPLELSI